MDWLIPSIIATLASSVLLATAYGYLYYKDRHRAMGIWLLAWSVYALRFVFMLAVARAETPDPLMLAGNQLCVLVSGYLLMRGTYEYIGRPTPLAWLWFVGADALWIAYGVSSGTSLTTLSLPTFLFLGALYAWTGLVLIRERGAVASQRAVGVNFILWGLHKADYPFLRPVLWFAPWGYLLGAAFQVFSAIGIILMYFERARAELAASEERFRNLMEYSPVPMVMVRPSGTVEHINRAARRTFGYSLEEIKDTDTIWERLFPDREARAQARAEYAELASGTRANGPRRWSIACHDGTRREVDVQHADLGNTGVLTFHDMTAHLAAEAGLRASLAEKEVLLQEIHHRVKNNLQIVASLLELQAHGIEDETVKQYLRESNNRVKSMALIHKMLYRSESLSAVDVPAYLGELSGIISSSIGIAGTHPDVEVTADPLSLGIDTLIPLGLIVTELLTNALKYAVSPGKGRVEISLEDLGTHGRLVVADNGPGLPGGLDTKNPVTLGLQLTTTLTSQIEGSLMIEDNHPGTRFTITFPLSAE
jgi:PAS domain S-box-containing protein